MKPISNNDDPVDMPYQGRVDVCVPDLSDEAIVKAARGRDARQLSAGYPEIDEIRRLAAANTPAGMKCWILGWPEEFHLGFMACFFDEHLAVPPRQLVVEKYYELHRIAAERLLKWEADNGRPV